VRLRTERLEAGRPLSEFKSEMDSDVGNATPHNLEQ